jgi:hypothetical protein
MAVLTPFLDRLKAALAFARTAGEVKRGEEAERHWDAVYGSLKRSGDAITHTDRGRGYVVRLSMLFALADHSTVIMAEHLRAALALWTYCRESARLIFQGQAEAVPDPLWLRVLNAIDSTPGIPRSELLRAFRSVSADELDELLTGLEVQRRAHRRMEKHEGSGRPSERWYPGEDDNPVSPPPMPIPLPPTTGRKARIRLRGAGG